MGCVGSHLHAADINRQHGGEEEHLQEEVGHQPHDGEQTELLRDAQTSGGIRAQASTSTTIAS